MEHANWDPRIEKFKRTLNLWKTRSLSLRGKSLVINQLAASGLWYTGSIFPLPKWASHSINASIWDFFWGGKPNFVELKTCYLPREQGGHAVVNVDSKVQALHLGWITNFLHGPEGKWKDIFENNFNKFQKLHLGQDLLNAKLNNARVRALPKFYSEILFTTCTRETSWKGSVCSQESVSLLGLLAKNPVLRYVFFPYLNSI